jgi:uncharacterized membrane protein YGL010W
MSPVLAAHFSDYAVHHRSRGNQVCHYLGIPLILLTALALLSRVSLIEVGGFSVTLAEVLVLAGTAYYLTLDRALALLMLVVSVGLLVAGRQLPLGWAAGLFALGWVFQLAGHSLFEHRAPAFLHNLAHLLIGPLWIVAKAIGRA